MIQKPKTGHLVPEPAGVLRCTELPVRPVQIWVPDVLYPAFNDTHNHQLPAARDLDYVSLEQARSVDELVQALREAAARTPAGQWIISSRCWHETPRRFR